MGLSFRVSGDLNVVYTVQRNADDPQRWDVVRNAPTIVSEGLRENEADALAFALNVQINKLEGRSGEPR